MKMIVTSNGNMEVSGRKDGSMLEKTVPVKELIERLKTRNNTFVALKSFTDAARKYSSQASNNDIVLSYLKASSNAEEILEFLESSRHSPIDYSVIFDALEVLLLRLTDTDDLISPFHPIALSVVRRILQISLKSIYYLLSGNNKAHHIKSGLKLLSAMVAVNAQCAREVTAIFDFSNSSLSSLINRRDIKDHQDVRSCLIIFMCSFLMSDDNNVIRQVVQSKGFLNSVFPGLEYDKSHIIDIFLSTLQSKIVENTSITKTIKIRLMNDYTLTQILCLYKWSGPKRQKHLKKKENTSNEMHIESTASDEEKEVVRHSLHTLLCTVLTSLKLGIIFSDKSCGKSGKNANHIVTNILKAIEKPFEDPLTKELVISVLEACPDQIRFYYQHIQPSVSNPRSSGNWMDAMKYVNEIVANIDFMKIFESLEKLKPLDIAELFVEMIFPRNIFSKEFFINCLINEELVRNLIIDVLYDKLTKMNEFMSHSETYSCKENIFDLLLSRLPPIKSLIKSWEDVYKNHIDDEKITFPTLLKIVNIISAYQIASPHSFMEENIDFSIFISFIDEGKKFMDENKTVELHLCIFELLSQGRFHQMLLSKNSFKLLLTSLKSDSKSIRSTSKQLLRQILKKIALISDEDILNFWIETFQTDQDEICDFYVEVLTHLASKISQGSDLDTYEGDNVLQMICGIDSSDLLSNEKAYTVDHITKSLLDCLKNNSSGRLVCYVSTVLNSLIHFQSETKLFCNYLKSFQPLLTEDLNSYLSFWIEQSSDFSKSKKFKFQKKLSFQVNLQQFVSCDLDSFDLLEDWLNENGQGLKEIEAIEIVHQLLHYIKKINCAKINKLIHLLNLLMINSIEVIQIKLFDIILDDDKFYNDFLQGEIYSPAINSTVYMILKSKNVSSSALRKYINKIKDNILHRQASECCHEMESNVIHLALDFMEPTDCIEIINKTNQLFLFKIPAETLVKLFEKCFVDNSEENIESISTNFVHQLSEYVCVNKSEDVLRFYLEFIMKSPAHSIINCNKIFTSLLEVDSPSGLRICEYLMLHNYQCYEIFHQWIIEKNLIIDNCKQKSTLILVYLLNHSIDKGTAVQYLEDVYWQCVDESIENCSSDVAKIFATLVKNYSIDKKKLKKIKSTLLDGCSSGMLYSKELISLAKETFHKKPYKVINSILNGITHLLSTLNDENSTYLSEFVDQVSSMLKDEINVDSKAFRSEIASNFVKQVLKTAMKMKYHKFKLFNLLNLLLNRDDFISALDFPLSDLFAMIIGHSKFLDVMLDEKFITVKESVIDVITTLIKRDKNLCNEKHIPILLGGYSATLSIIDQKLLTLIYLYETVDHINFHQFKPFIWGQSAISHYSISKNVNMTLWTQPKMEEVLEAINTENMITSAANFPLSLSLKEESLLQTHTNISHLESYYDPRFMFPFFSQLLSPENFVHFPKFIETGCLSFVFSSLSSFDSGMRAAGYHLLELYYVHLEGARKFRNRHVYLLLLNILKNGIINLNQRLPSIVSLFMSKVCLIFYNSNDMMYQPLFQFITIRPFLDIEHVPEFYNLFFSDDLSFSSRRNWILKLLADGLKSNMDFFVCERRHIFHLLLSAYHSSIADQQTRSLILEVLLSATSSQSAVRKLLNHYDIIGWIQQAMLLSNMKNDRRKFIKLLGSLFKAFEQESEDKEKKNQNNVNLNESKLVHENKIDKMKNYSNQMLFANFSILQLSSEIISEEELHDTFFNIIQILEYSENAKIILSSSNISTALTICKNLTSSIRCQIKDDQCGSYVKLLLRIITFWKPGPCFENCHKLLFDAMIIFLGNIHHLESDRFHEGVNWIRSCVTSEKFLSILCQHEVEWKSLIQELLNMGIKLSSMSRNDEQLAITLSSLISILIDVSDLIEKLESVQNFDYMKWSKGKRPAFDNECEYSGSDLQRIFEELALNFMGFDKTDFRKVAKKRKRASSSKGIKLMRN